MCVLLITPPRRRFVCAKRDAPLAALLVLAHSLRSARALTRGAHPVSLTQSQPSAAYSLPQRTRAPALLRAACWTTTWSPNTVARSRVKALLAASRPELPSLSGVSLLSTTQARRLVHV